MNIKNDKTKKALFLGDIVNNAGKNAINKYLKQAIDKYKFDFIIANAENISSIGRGITDQDAQFLFDNKIDLITLGNHTYAIPNQQCFEDERVIRPANFPSHLPGKGFSVIIKDDLKYAVINVLGNKDMNMIVDNVFFSIEKILKTLSFCNFILVDIHASSSIEKQCIANYFNGKVTAIIGTHTHVPTNDCKILNKGTAYQTDTGMCGSYSGINGKQTYKIMNNFVYWQENNFNSYQNMNEEEVTMCGCVIYFDPSSARATSIKPLIYGSFISGAIR